MYKHTLNKIIPNNFTKNLYIIKSFNKNFSETPKPSQIDQKYKNLIDSLNKDWNKIASEKEEIRMNKIKDQLLPSQKKFIEMLAENIVQLNTHQINKFIKGYKEKQELISTVSPITINESWLALQKSLDDKLPKEGTRFLEQEELMKQLSKWYKDQTPGFGISAGPAQEAKKEEQKEVKKEEKVVLKEAYDIELVSFDAGKKIALIKEVRGYTNLGLKEAKELVEKAPTVILKGIKRAETDAILKKIAEVGGNAQLKG